MLTEPDEIRIIARARQKHVRDPRTSRVKFDHILQDFFAEEHFSGKRILDLGPGQHDFGEMARARGATVWGMDNDEAVVELGRYKNFNMVYGRMQDIQPLLFEGGFDGLFCKFSINAFWFHDDHAAQGDFIDRLFLLLNPGGWVWIGPWNRRPKTLSRAEGERILEFQREKFESHGTAAYHLSRKLAQYYGIKGNVDNHALFARNTRIPPAVAACRGPK